jgi:16S rRNA (guanine1516-N2)-methyltransferase
LLYCVRGDCKLYHLSVIVTWQTPACKLKAEQLAQTLNLSLAKSAGYNFSENTSTLLQVTEDRIELISVQDKTAHAIFAEFLTGPLGYRWLKGGGRNQAIARAVGLRTGAGPTTVLDATAGLGRDAFILASLGCTVQLIERSPIIATLLINGLLRASQDPKGAMVTQSMTVIMDDAKKILAALTPEQSPDVVYLDPMFPHRDKSALTKIEMRLIRNIVGDDKDADMLLPLALKKARKRVVVKRQRYAPVLEGYAPSFVVKGKSNRYDIYLTGGHL